MKVRHIERHELVEYCRLGRNPEEAIEREVKLREMWDSRLLERLAFCYAPRRVGFCPRSSLYFKIWMTLDSISAQL